MAKTVGLRTEILTTVTLLMGAALLLGGLLVLRLTEQKLVEQKVSQLRSINQILVQSLQQDRKRLEKWTSDEIAQGFLQRLPTELNNTGWWLYSSSLRLTASYQTGANSVISASQRQQVKLSQEAEEQIEFPSLLQFFGAAEARAHFALPLIAQSRFLGLLEIQYSLDDVRLRLLSAQRLVLTYILLYGVVLVGIGYYLLQRNVVKPARNLLQATDDVARGHLDTRLPVAGPVEIASLAEAYNQMVEALQRSRSETRSHIETLELTNEQLQQTRAELIRSEKLASVGQLAAGMAHELGNPLAALIGYLELLKTRVTEADTDIVKRSLQETERIDYLVRELLDFSRPTVAEAENLDPLVPLRAAVELLQNQGLLRAEQVVDQLPTALPVIKANRQKVQQLFINLLLNAIQACAGEGCIQLSAEAEDGCCRISITDNGSGIESASVDKIFDPFFTTKAPGEGTGLGLSICYRIVEELNGTISVQSMQGYGSTFMVEFPEPVET